MSSTQANNHRTEVLVAEVSGPSLLNAVKLRLAAQYAPPQWRPAIDSVAQRIESGESLDGILSTVVLPTELRQLFFSALKVKDPPQLVLDALQARLTQRATWREFLSLLIYPLFSLAFAVAVGLVFTWMTSALLDIDYIEDFGLQDLDWLRATIADQNQAILGIGILVGWTVITVATIAIAGPPWALTSICGGIILFGRPLRWINLIELIKRYQLFITQGLPPTDAASAVSQSFSSSGQRFVALAVERRIMQGMSIGNAIAQSSLSDGLCRPVLRMLDFRGPNLAQSLNETAEIMQRLTDQRCRSLSALMPVLVVFIVGTIIWGLVSNYALSTIPLIRMITSLA